MKNILVAIGLLLSILHLESCSLALKRADNLYADVQKERYTYDAIIVPGVPLQQGLWDSVMKARVLWAVHLYQTKVTKNIIFSGGAVYTPYYEAVAMGLYAQKLGVPAKHIYYDTLAEHSTENVYFSYLMARKLGFKKLALATDPFQSVMLKAYTRRRFRSHIQHIPVIFDIIKGMNKDNLVIDPALAYRPGFVSITEKESFGKRLMGTMGKQVYYGPDKRLGKL